MVSTRQMSTSLSSSNGGANDEGLTVATRFATRHGGAAPSTSRMSSLPSDILGRSEQQKIFLLDLPVEILDKIFSYVGYKKVGHMRAVSKRMNDVCGTILNSTFVRLTTQMSNRFQTIKAKMPRRESARRNHPLACECDIIETCHMRLSLLQMTFGKHIERKLCCFFPGGILDEVNNIVNYIRSTTKLERPYKVTDELFDLSTMAMEFFKEKLEPNLPEIVYVNKDFFDIPSTKSKQTYSSKAVLDLSDDSSNTPPQSNMVLRKGIRKIKQGMKMYNNQLSVLRCELRTCKRKSSEQGKQIAEQQKLLAEQQKQTLEYASRLDENDKKNEEISRKFSTMLQELNKCKTELQYWRSKSPAIQNCTYCGNKIAPFVPPDDYQALVNQGVKPEDINMTIDDIEESDTSTNTLSDSGVEGGEFAFPDETTTAKLLAANSASKNMKRTYTESSASVSNTDAGHNENNLHGMQCFNAVATTSASTQTAAGNEGTVNIINRSGYPTEVFYGLSDRKNSRGHPTTTAIGKIAPSDAGSVSLASIDSPSSSASLASVADVTSITCIANNETKKARRVQKGSRCHNVSGNSKRK